MQSQTKRGVVPPGAFFELVFQRALRTALPRERCTLGQGSLGVYFQRSTLPNPHALNCVGEKDFRRPYPPPLLPGEAWLAHIIYLNH